MKKMLLLSMVLLCLPLALAQTTIFYYDKVDDLTLGKAASPMHYYTIFQWDVGGTFDGVFTQGLKANMSIYREGGYCSSNINVFLLPNQSINLTTGSTTSILSQQKSNQTTSYISATGDNYQYIDLTSQLLETLKNSSNRKLTIWLESTGYNSVVPTDKYDNESLYLCSDSNYIRFTASEKPAPTNQRPRLIVSTNIPPINGTYSVSPYEHISLPQINSSCSIDNEGIKRTYLYCSWRIDGNGQEVFNMTSTLCPDPVQSFTFNDADQDYLVRIDYSTISYNVSTHQWQLDSIGTCDSLHQQYNVEYPEPPTSLLSQIWNQIWNSVKSWVCGIFPFMWFC